MKLRNKKTGETINGCFVVCEYKDGARFSVKDKPCFDSLDELKEEWEDYKPIEPIIKDEKVRKAVRAWAKANDYSLVKIGPNDGYVQIHFERSDIVDEDKYGVHTITELCGEEEE